MGASTTTATGRQSGGSVSIEVKGMFELVGADFLNHGLGARGARHRGVEFDHLERDGRERVGRCRRRRDG